jgi:O-antigen/teichoic acid export membrane protein
MIYPDVMTNIMVAYFAIAAVVFLGINFIHAKAYGRRKTLKMELFKEHLGIAAGWPLMIVSLLIFLIERVTRR